ncbi:MULTISPECIES: alkaline phosphatase [Actinomadura]|uniref:Alkaline phosphatase n=1 Tax=Actinomadura litoris TaxID=2678616 RepID=A0A7K1KVC9_9ACTN|nr:MULTISPECIES: alkaline phosphatase D family protein [Actinomadura]MBT2211217.1 alkaline phosphatase D family protein [Actinomadura sp. NEAU-AAG7]MUN36134.1 alkaline phosphatase [Actinomadura litoris]
MRSPLPARRSFLAATGAGAAAFALGTGHAAAKETVGGKVPADPFTLGVASGDPLPDGVVLWTRLAPRPLAPDGHGGMPRSPYTVDYEVAEDAGFARVVQRGQAVASPELGHSVHAEVNGLSPDREYFYRFRAGTELSPVGRTRTAPDPASGPAELRFVAASCAAWYHGHFTAFEHLAKEDPDLVVFLGDYIYEYGITGTNMWREGVPLPGPEHAVETTTLEQYRLRYSLFKSDANLQAAHAAAPWVFTTDDHDVQNNYADDWSETGIAPADFLRRRAVAYRALYENLPLRAASLPNGPAIDLYQRRRWGRLAQLDLLDNRQYRDKYPAGQVVDDSPERHDPRRSILGDRQEQWLYDGLRVSDTTWNLHVTGVVMAQIDRTPGAGSTFSNDMWDGFPANRDRLFSAWKRHGVANPVVLSGDIHRHVAADLKATWENPASATVGTELVCGSAASDGDGADTDSSAKVWLANPHVKLYNARRGYLRCRMTPTALTSEFMTVPYVSRPGAPLATAARFVTEAGRPGLNREV